MSLTESNWSGEASVFRIIPQLAVFDRIDIVSFCFCNAEVFDKTENFRGGIFVFQNLKLKNTL